ncbi:MAG TPA: sulfite exporter TauE/SafE family protein [Acidimicrobiales bacterium]|nr:sulfite exporter TauE/SafE family protein [Acidimicrobiales bacterium]
MHLDVLDYLAAAGAGGAAGAINALAGGGTLVSFSTLVGLGVPPVTANVTNTVSLVPGYLSGAWAQRDDLSVQIRHAWGLAAVAFAGGLCGSVLLVTIPAHDFKVVVPYLILLACALLLAQDWLRERLRPDGDRKPGPAGSSAGSDAGPAVDPPGIDIEEAETTAGAGPIAEGGAVEVKQVHGPARGEHMGAGLLVAVFGAAVYGGFFGAGLGIMLLAVLGLLTTRPLLQVNALKQALSFVINVVAAVFFALSGHVMWELVPVMAAAAIIGAILGTRLVRVINPAQLRFVVVLVGVAVAIAFWVTN